MMLTMTSIQYLSSLRITKHNSAFIFTIPKCPLNKICKICSCSEDGMTTIIPHINNNNNNIPPTTTTKRNCSVGIDWLRRIVKKG